jgi:osmotically-inducible protein OsmY
MFQLPGLIFLTRLKLDSHRMKPSLKFLFPFLLMVAAGCSYNQHPAAYRSAPYGSPVVSSPAYTSGTPQVTTGSSPPVYSAPPAANAAVYAAQSSVATANNLVADVQQALRSSDLSDLAPNLNVSSQNGTVTLSGYVPTERDKQLAETLARNTAGVVSVNDQIQVLPSPTGGTARVYPPGAASQVAGDIFNLHVQGLNDTDRSMAQKILEGLRTDTALNSLLPSVNITVAGGRVILQGRVQSEQQRQTIESVVRQATGSGAVEDQLQVVGP